jgi:hypothetical protein
VEEDVGDFEVAMDDVLFRKILKSLEDVPDDGFGLVLVEVSFLAESGLEVALAAEFGDDVAVAVAGEYLVAFEDVGVVQLFEDVDLGEEEFLEFLALQRLELDYLDGYNVISS